MPYDIKIDEHGNRVRVGGPPAARPTSPAPRLVKAYSDLNPMTVREQMVEAIAKALHDRKYSGRSWHEATAYQRSERRQEAYTALETIEQFSARGHLNDVLLPNL